MDGRNGAFDLPNTTYFQDKMPRRVIGTAFRCIGKCCEEVTPLNEKNITGCLEKCASPIAIINNIIEDDDEKVKVVVKKCMKDCYQNSKDKSSGLIDEQAMGTCAEMCADALQNEIQTFTKELSAELSKIPELTRIPNMTKMSESNEPCIIM